MSTPNRAVDVLGMTDREVVKWMRDHCVLPGHADQEAWVKKLDLIVAKQSDTEVTTPFTVEAKGRRRFSRYRRTVDGEVVLIERAASSDDRRDG